MITRLLGGRSFRKRAVPIENEHGVPTTSEKERQEVWEKHFASVFGGAIADEVARHEETCASIGATELIIDVSVVERAFKVLKMNKGAAGDGIPMELLRAEGDAIKTHPAAVRLRIAQQRKSPMAWAGGVFL